MSKLKDPEFINYLKAFSLVCLTETFVNKEDTSNLDKIYSMIIPVLLHLPRSYPNTEDVLGVCCVLLGLIYCICFSIGLLTTIT